MTIAANTNAHRISAAQGDTAMLAMEGINLAYDGLRAIAGLDLQVGPSQVVCLLGPSGCGKTSALRVAAGLEAPQTGTVRIGGQLMTKAGEVVPPERRGVGLVFQDYALFPHLSVRDNVGYGLKWLNSDGRMSRVNTVLDQVGMLDTADAYPHMLSGGQQQRVALARALAPQPSVILMDEPFSGLDARLRDSVRDRTLHVLKESEAAVLMVTHDSEEAMFMADRIALMRNGHIVQEGQPEELYCQPADSFVAGFFGEVNRVQTIVRDGRVETPFGALPAPGLEEGSEAEVIIRPEALRVGPMPGGAAGAATVHVRAARLLGRTSLLHLTTDAGSGFDLHLHARVPGRYLPPEDVQLQVELDRSQAFVFPLETVK